MNVHIYIYTYVHTCFCVCIPTLLRECVDFVQNNRLPSFPPKAHGHTWGLLRSHVGFDWWKSTFLESQMVKEWNIALISPKRIPPLFHVSLLNFVNLSRHIVNHVSPSVEASFPSKSIYIPIVMLSIYIYRYYIWIWIFIYLFGGCSKIPLSSHSHSSRINNNIYIYYMYIKLYKTIYNLCNPRISVDGFFPHLVTKKLCGKSPRPPASSPWGSLERSSGGRWGRRCPDQKKVGT